MTEQIVQVGGKYYSANFHEPDWDKSITINGKYGVATCVECGQQIVRNLVTDEYWQAVSQLHDH